MALDSLSELDLQGALRLVSEKKAKLVWLGSEPVEYICGLLGVESSYMIGLDPNDVLALGSADAKSMAGNVFLCYHGITSGFVVEYLQREYGLEVYHLKGGISSVIGEL